MARINQLLCLFLILLTSITAGAEQDADPAKSQKAKSAEPLYEWGVAGGTFYTPDYPGASQGQWRTLGAPYMIYRGKVFRAGDEGIRSRFIDMDNIELDISAAAAFPATSKDNFAREGMPDLDWIGEVGPRLTFRLLTESEKNDFEFNLPARLVFSSDFTRLDWRGVLVQPNFLYKRNELFGGHHTAYFGMGLIFGSNQLMDYFYQVDQQYARLDRPAYNAEAGYMGAYLRLGMSYVVKPKRFWMFVGMQAHYYEGATNIESPLLKQRLTSSLALGFIWNIFKSEEKAEQWF